MEPQTESPVDATADGASTDAPRDIHVRCWGTRGSIPSPGPGTAGYGGNTSCVSVRVGSLQLIFDAGTGIRLLGEKLAQTNEPLEAHLFLSHFHWDHIQGFPFFAPIYNPETRLEVVGPRQRDQDIEAVFSAQMNPVSFPIPFDAVAAELNFRHMNEDVWEADGVRVRSMRVRHPSYSVGYRMDAPGASICYVPDNELEGGEYPVKDDWRGRFVEFIEGADVLFHDAMFTEEEYPSRVGWGHSTFRQTLDLAVEAGVRQIYFFHHAPERTDAELNPVLQAFRDEKVERGLDLSVNAAFEGKEIRIEEK